MVSTGGHGAPAVAVIGSGYVGTVVAACLAKLGRHVVAVEADRRKLEDLERGIVPFYEPGLQDLLDEGLRRGLLGFTASVEEACAHSEAVFVCVGTPPSADGSIDVGALEAALSAVGASVRRARAVVIKSTVPIGTGSWATSLLKRGRPSTTAETAVPVVLNPEFLREGSAISDFLFPDRVVIGSDDRAALDAVAEVYEPILTQAFPEGDTGRRPPLVRTTLATAETVKFASNAFLALKISFINEVANVCGLVGADVCEVAAILGLDSRIGPRFLDAGVGWGGSCFAKDLNALITTAQDHGFDAPLLRAAATVNQRQREIVVERLRSDLDGLDDRRIALLGLAFKPCTDDLRDAPAVAIATMLLHAGAAVRAHDPLVASVPQCPDLEVCEDPYEAAEGADAVLLVTEWPDYFALDFGKLAMRMRGDLVLDGRNVFDAGAVAGAGLRYEGIGRHQSRDLSLIV